MRGTVIRWSGERGIVAAAGQRYEFDISHWQAAIAPAANMPVDVATADGTLTGVTPVNKAEPARPTLGAMPGEGRRRAQAIVANVGQDVAIGYAAFLLLAMFVGFVSTGGFVEVKLTLADLLSGDGMSAALGDGSGKGVLLVLLATATIAVPHFWKHRFAPLAFATPLVFTLIGFWPIYEQHRRQQDAIEALGELGDGMTDLAEQLGAQTSAFDAIGWGAWVLFATAIFLAFKGIARILARRQRDRSVTSSSAS